jgi:hypothetical protein
MPNVAGPAAPSPIALPHKTVDDLETLRRMVSTAVRVEFTTIPPYLTALYSITDTSSDAYQALRSVVVEEMFHVNQASNLLVAIGGRPTFTGQAVPTYPTFLPSASRSAALPYVGLYRASTSVFQNVFMNIEMPAPFDAPAEGAHYKTIGQFYKAIEEGLVRCVDKYGPAGVFQQATGMRQRSDIYLGKFGGRAIDVHDLDSARFAILQIVEQGEGAVDPTRPLAPEEPFAAYAYYGRRIDGTYGPILGTPFELSHYFKFKRVVDSGTFPDTFPIVSNPRVAEYSNDAARKAAVTFNASYSVMLKSLERAFALPTSGHDVYFEITLPLMHAHLPQIARQLMTTPIAEEGDPSVGPNAAPTFEYNPAARLPDVVDLVGSLRQHAQRPAARVGAPFARAARPIVQTPRPLASDPHKPQHLDELFENVRTLSRRSDAAGFDL